MKKQTIFIIIYFLLFCLFLYSSCMIVQYAFLTNQNRKVENRIVQNTSIEEEKDIYPYQVVNLEKSILENSDTVGWIQVQGTNINYPVVQSFDNTYYLNHSFDGSSSSVGWIFMDYRNQFDHSHIMIYGHNRLDGAMFGSLKNTEIGSYIFLNSKDTCYTYQVFSKYIVPVEEFNNSLELNEEFLQSLPNELNIEIHSNNPIITLYTCHGYFNERLIVHGKLIQTKKVL